MIFSRSLPLLALALFCSYLRCFAQFESGPEEEKRADATIDRVPEDFDYTELLESLECYRSHPLDLNSATANELGRLGFLSPLQISSLLRYRASNGPFIQIEELQAVEELDMETIAKLKLYTVVRERNSSAFKGQRPAGVEQSLALTFQEVLQRQKGFRSLDSSTAPSYAGSPLHALLRYKLTYQDRLTLSLLMEKDPGERTFARRAGGFDFCSAALQLQNLGPVKKLVVGDYSMKVGQGAALWTGFAAGKGSSPEYFVRQHGGMQLYSSANEAGFLRGASATMVWRKLDVTPFISRKRLDARLETDSAGAISGFTSLSNSGLHRTSAELNNRHSISENVYGMTVEWNDVSSRLGAVVYHDAMSVPPFPSPRLCDLFALRNRSVTNAALFYSSTWKNTCFFGEFAHTVHNGIATVNGIISALSKRLSLVLLQRLYQKNYYSFYCQSIREGGNGDAEAGFISGITLNGAKGSAFSIYTDLFRFPWLRYYADAPSQGHEILAIFSFPLSKSSNLSLRYRSKTAGENDQGQAEVRHVQDVRKQNLRLGLEFKSGSFLFRSRGEAVVYKKDCIKEIGSLLYQDVIFKPTRSRASFSARFAIFGSDSFNTAIYAMENSYLNLYSSSAYYDEGVRFYVNAKYKVGRFAELAARYAVSSYANADQIGSGLAVIDGHRKADLGVQLKLRL